MGEILAEGCEKGFIEIKPAAYNIVLEDGTYEGEMKLGIRYIPNVTSITSKKISIKFRQNFDFIRPTLSVWLPGRTEGANI